MNINEFLDFLNSSVFVKYVILVGIGALFVIGMFGIMKKKNIIKIVMGIGIVETAINLLFIVLSYESNKTAPIFTDGVKASSMADPIPQAMVLTSIVIGVAVMSLGLTMAVRYYKITGKTNISKMNELNG